MPLSQRQCQGADPVHKASIIPRGRALGIIMQLPERDKLSMSHRADDVAAGHHDGRTRGGRTRLRQGEGDLGRASDIEQATELARMMVELGHLGELRRRGLRREPGRSVPRHVRWLALQNRRRRQRKDRHRRSGGWSRISGYTEARAVPRKKRPDLEIARRGSARIRDAQRATRSRTCLPASGRSRESTVEPVTPRSCAVPPAGKPRPRPETGSLEPQPQA